MLQDVYVNNRGSIEVWIFDVYERSTQNKTPQRLPNRKIVRKVVGPGKLEFRVRGLPTPDAKAKQNKQMQNL
jgi:hypothetical protein